MKKKSNNTSSCIINWDLHHKLNKTNEKTLKFIKEMDFDGKASYSIIPDKKSRDTKLGK